MLTLAGGCSVATVDEPLTKTLSGNDRASQMEFWHSLYDQPVTSTDDAFHALLLFSDEQDPAEDYGDRVRLFQKRGWIPDNFATPANQAITRGTVAVILTKLLNIKGGLTIKMIGNHPRYAVRELRFVGLYPPSSPHQTFTGVQFASLMGRVEDYQRTPETEWGN